MPSETTPLSPTSDLATNLLTQENAQAAGAFAKEKFDELRKQASDGDFSIRIFALLGGMALIVLASFEFLGKILTLHLVGAVMDVFSFALGIIILILEGGEHVPLPSSFLVNLHTYALFLKYVWGRGILYFVAGTLQLSQMGIFDIAVGGWLCGVGVLYIIVGKVTANKLQTLRKSAYSEETLKAKFHEADSTGSGTLNMQEFKALTLLLGMDLNRRETEAAFLMLDKDDNHGELSYSEFETWWNTQDVATSFHIV